MVTPLKLEPATAQKSIVFLMGVSGTGKTTIGKLLAQMLQVPFIDGDDYHPQANIDKMGAGQPLDDDDRFEWLETLNRQAHKHLSTGGVIVCSALKKSYRKILMHELPVEHVRWVHLTGSPELIEKRLQQRGNHFFKPQLLKTQLEALEPICYGIKIDIDQSPKIIVAEILKKMEVHLGIVGLGVMGTALARNLGKNGFKLSLYNRYLKGVDEKIADKAIAKYEELQEAQGYEDLLLFLRALPTPRIILMMIPAGAAVDEMIRQLVPNLNPQDVLIDGGNSHYLDTERRIKTLAEKQINFMGMGVSGGEKGALNGPSMMLGGNQSISSSILFPFKTIAAQNKDKQTCCAWLGTGGTGHFVKMIHNGIEYAEMQLIAEVFGILKNGLGYGYEQIAHVFEDWNKGNLKSYLLSITIQILQTKDSDHYVLDDILDQSEQNGTGAWSVIAAAHLGVPASILSSAVEARQISEIKAQRTHLAELYNNQSKPVEINLEELKNTYRFGRILNHHQGLAIIQKASEEYQWEINLRQLIILWTEGCIIKSNLLYDIEKGLKDHQLPVFHYSFRKVLKNVYPDIKKVVGVTAQADIPTPCLYAALSYFQQLKESQSTANLIMAQRDFFGAHGYIKVNGDLKKYKTNWHKQ